MQGVYQPTMEPGLEFYAMGYFVYLWEFMKMPASGSLSDLRAMAEKVCAMDAEELAKFSSDKYRSGYCFGAWYAINLLHKGYGMPMVDTPLFVTADVDGTEVTWALGSIIMHVNKLEWDLVPRQSGPSPHPSRADSNDGTSVSRTVFVITVVLLGALVLSLATVLLVVRSSLVRTSSRSQNQRGAISISSSSGRGGGGTGGVDDNGDDDASAYRLI